MCKVLKFGFYLTDTLDWECAEEGTLIWTLHMGTFDGLPVPSDKTVSPFPSLLAK